MSRPPLFTPATPLYRVAAIIGHEPGSLGLNKIGTSQYRALAALLEAAGLPAGQGARARYDGADLGAWYRLNQYKPIGAAPRMVEGDPPPVPVPPMVPVPMAPAPVPVPATVTPSADDAAALADLLRRMTGAGSNPIDADAVRELIRAELANIGALPTRVEIVTAPGSDPIDVGIQHKCFPDLLQFVTARRQDGSALNIWLPGPAGSGKTRAAMEVAKALNLDFAFTSVLDSKYELSGFRDASGTVAPTEFRRIFENGGVFLLDEIDGADPSIPLWMNAPLANGVCAFPDGIVKRHPDCRIIAAANTWGHGGNADYVGRFKQDAAFISRFVHLPWEIDEALELAITGNDGWVSRVQSVRARVKAKGIKAVISPRASIDGAALLAIGLPFATVETATLRQGMSDADWQEVR